MRTMTLEQFNICLDFHLALIRSKPEAATINDARDYLLSGTVQDKSVCRKKADNLANHVIDRFDSLRKWGSTNDSKCLIKIYNKRNTRNPSSNAFIATFKVLDGASINESAKNHGVNYQCIKVLKPRIERWDDYANRLRKVS